MQLKSEDIYWSENLTNTKDHPLPLKRTLIYPFQLWQRNETFFLVTADLPNSEILFIQKITLPHDENEDRGTVLILCLS